MPSGMLAWARPCRVMMLMPRCKPGEPLVQELNRHSIAHDRGRGLRVARSDSELLPHACASRCLFIQKLQGSLGRSQGSRDHDLSTQMRKKIRKITQSPPLGSLQRGDLEGNYRGKTPLSLVHHNGLAIISHSEEGQLPSSITHCSAGGGASRQGPEPSVSRA